MIGTFLSRAGGAAFCAIGVGGLLSPEALGTNYGVSAASPEAQAYVRATAARDLVLGLLILRFSVRGERDALTATLAVSTIAALTDAVNAAGTPSVALHAGGAVALLAAAAFVAAER
jgi:peptidoglycan/LPS O-acetylase OafA/YrhL